MNTPASTPADTPANTPANTPADILGRPQPDVAVLIPVKRPRHAKTRLGDLGDDVRRQLAAAFAADTVAAALGCRRVVRVLVVTDDDVLAGTLQGLGADVVPDGAADLNGTLVQAAAEMHRRDPGLRLAAVCADLPALRHAELAAVLDAADPTRLSFVADQERVGTTTVVAPDLASFRPAFGAGSRSAHLDEGAFEIDGIDVPSVRRDVDGPDDLAAAMQLGVGPRTASVAARLQLPGTVQATVQSTVQATVSAYDEQTRAGRVLLDDGTRWTFEASATEGTGLRLLRPGQRVRVESAPAGTDGSVRVTRVQIVTLG